MLLWCHTSPYQETVPDVQGTKYLLAAYFRSGVAQETYTSPPKKAIDGFPARRCTAPIGMVTYREMILPILIAFTCWRALETCHLQITGAFTTLKGLSGLLKWRAIHIQHVTLPILRTYCFCRKGGSSLTINSNAELLKPWSIYALDSITAQLNIHDNTKLMNVDGLSSLRSAGSLFVGDKPFPHQCEGVNVYCSYLEVLNIGGNDLLSNLDGLNLIKEVGSFRYGSNAALRQHRCPLIPFCRPQHDTNYG